VIVQHVRARDVRGQQIRRELDAPEAQAERLGDAAHEQGLGEPWHTHEQRVPPSEQRHEQRVHHFFLADHDPRDLLLEPSTRASAGVEEVRVVGELGCGSHVGVDNSRKTGTKVAELSTSTVFARPEKKPPPPLRSRARSAASGLPPGARAC
jgi:hypothetical protein